VKPDARKIVLSEPLALKLIRSETRKPACVCACRWQRTGDFRLRGMSQASANQRWQREALADGLRFFREASHSLRERAVVVLSASGKEMNADRNVRGRALKLIKI
jgi:hypothetical protein